MPNKQERMEAMKEFIANNPHGVPEAKTQQVIVVHIPTPADDGSALSFTTWYWSMSGRLLWIDDTIVTKETGEKSEYAESLVEAFLRRSTKRWD